MKKITAYQIAPEYQTSPLEYSDAPENVYIFGNNHMNGINADEIDDIYNALETLAAALDALETYRAAIDKYNSLTRGNMARASDREGVKQYII